MDEHWEPTRLLNECAYDFRQVVKGRPSSPSWVADCNLLVNGLQTENPDYAVVRDRATKILLEMFWCGYSDLHVGRPLDGLIEDMLISYAGLPRWEQFYGELWGGLLQTRYAQPRTKWCECSALTCESYVDDLKRFKKRNDEDDTTDFQFRRTMILVRRVIFASKVFAYEHDRPPNEVVDCVEILGNIFVDLPSMIASLGIADAQLPVAVEHTEEWAVTCHDAYADLLDRMIKTVQNSSPTTMSQVSNSVLATGAGNKKYSPPPEYDASDDWILSAELSANLGGRPSTSTLTGYRKESKHEGSDKFGSWGYDQVGCYRRNVTKQENGKGPAAYYKPFMSESFRQKLVRAVGGP